MKDTEQLNIRVSKGLIYDLELIARATGLSKSDWVRYKLAEAIRNAKNEALIEAESNFVMGRTGPAEYQKLTGFEPNKELQTRHDAYAQKMDKLLRGTAFKEFAKRALLEHIQDKKRK